jgi:pimeloyl-ACP methyl ester carboxylesterase
LGSDEALSVLTPEFLSLEPGFFATEVAVAVSSLKSLLQLCFSRQIPSEELYLMLGYSISVPPYVREALLSRSIDNDDLFPKLRKPVLITHGAEDSIVRHAVTDQYKAAIPNAQIQTIPNVGHAPFWEDAPTFNRLLREFSRSAPYRSRAAS